MRKFIKIVDPRIKNDDYQDKSWFLVVEPNNNQNLDDFNFKEILTDLNIKRAFNEFRENKADTPLDLLLNIDSLIARLDYQKKANDWNETILVRRNGTYMGMSKEYQITEIAYGNDFPVNNIGKIVVCENDAYAEDFWIDYLAYRFPDKQITVINNFRHRSKSEIDTYFEKAEFITFSSTFSNLDWWVKVSESLKSHNKVVGFSHSERELKKALIFFKPKDIEIIDRVTINTLNLKIL